MVFDQQGVCMGCRVHEEKDNLDWSERFKLLEKIVHVNSKRMGGKGFDCIIPVTGAGDSHFIVHTVKNVLGMNPLLVHYNSHYNTRVGIRNLANLRTVFDCDMVTSTLSPQLLKRITRHTMRKFGSMYWHVLAGNLTFPVQVAVRFRIPLIIWGVHHWSEQTGMYSHLDEVEMTERCRKEHALLGYAAEDLVDPSSGITRHDVQPFAYPDDTALEAIGVRGIYLSNFIRWDAKTQHEKMIDLYGYETAEQQRTFNTYEDVNCFHSSGIHDYIKYTKYGYGRVTDHASREIRLKRMSREQGIQQVSKYAAKKPNDLPVFLKWAEMSEEEFWSIVDRYRSPEVWARDSDGNYRLIDSVLNHEKEPGVDDVRLETIGDCLYFLTQHQEQNDDMSRYLLMGRGYIDKYNFGSVEPQPKDGLILPKTWQRKPIF